MAIIRFSDLKKLSKSERAEKVKELKLELIKSHLPANKTRSKTKEIKKTIARCLTLAKTDKEVSRS